jgi:hypothetical protein
MYIVQGRKKKFIAIKQRANTMHAILPPAGHDTLEKKRKKKKKKKIKQTAAIAIARAMKKVHQMHLEQSLYLHRIADQKKTTKSDQRGKETDARR